MQSRFLRGSLGALGVSLAALLCACGGGGGSSGTGLPAAAFAVPPAATASAAGDGTPVATGAANSTGGNAPSGPAINVSVTPSSVREVIAGGGGLSGGRTSLTLMATVLNPPTTPVFAFLVGPDVLLPATQPLFGAGKNIYGNYFFSFNTSLAPGDYKGDLTIKLCSDSGCATQYTVEGGSIPYDVTVLPAPEISVLINGVARTSPKPQNFNVKDGDVVTLQSSLPVSWGTAQGGVGSTILSSTSTTWKAKLQYGLSTPGGVGSFSVTALTLKDPSAPSNPQTQTEVGFLLTQ